MNIPENMGENSTLFDLGEYQSPEKERKKPETEQEKQLKIVRQMLERDFLNLQAKLNNSRKPLTAKEADRLREYERQLESEVGENIKDCHVRTGREVAEYFGKSLRTIRNWSGRGMPQNPDSYDLQAIEEWALKEGLIKERISPAPAGGIPAEPNGDQGQEKNRSHYELELKRLDSESKEFKLAVAKGEYVKKDKIAKEWAGRIAEVAKGLDYLKKILPPLLEGKSIGEMEATIDDEVWKIRDNYSRTGRFCPSNPDDPDLLVA